MKPNLYTAYGKTLTLREWLDEPECESTDNIESLRTRVKRMPIKQALALEPRRGKRLTIDGETKTIIEWSEDERCPVKLSTICARLNEGWTPEDAVLTPNKLITNEYIEAWGESKTFYQWTSDKRCNITTEELYRKRLASGMSSESALEAPYSRAESFHGWGQRKTLKEWSEDVRAAVDAKTIYDRVKVYGWDIEEAVTTPKFEPMRYEAFGKSLTAAEWGSQPECKVGQRALRWRHVKEGSMHSSRPSTIGMRLVVMAVGALVLVGCAPWAPATPPAPAPAPMPPAGGDAGTTVGSAAYPVPSGAVVVSPSGSDSAAGTASAPLATIKRAIQVASSGSTIVLRGGQYHETVVVPSNKRLTIQSWPSEAVWMEGSVPVNGWVADGGRWRHDGWTVDFDTSPTYTRGAPDNTASSWSFVNPSYPMAAHPDQMWLAGFPLRQVGSLSQVTADSFYHDRAANRLYIGADPAGREVRASDLVRAVSLRSDNSVVRGIGIRRYSPSVPDMGAVTLESPGDMLEHVVVSESATTGVNVSAVNVTLRNVHVTRSGMLGMAAVYADGLLVDKARSDDNNTERFNMSPVSGGIKIGRSRGITVRNGVFARNHGPGVWMDESVYDTRITGSLMIDNAGHGTSLELSSKAVFAGNRVVRSGRDGIKVNNTSDVQIWNNTFTGNGRSLNLVQDSRRASNSSTPGHDRRQPFPDPTMTWLLGPVMVANNVVANQRSGNCMLCVEDYSGERSAAQIGVLANGNVFNRPNSTTPSYLVVWSRGSGNPAIYTTAAAFNTAVGGQVSNLLVDGSAVVDADGQPTANLPTTVATLGLPQQVASLLGRSAGDRHLGTWL